MSWNVEYPKIKHRGIQGYLIKYRDTLLTEWKDRPTFRELLEGKDHKHQAFYVQVEVKRGRKENITENIFIDSKDYRHFIDRFCGEKNILDKGLLTEENASWADRKIELPDKLFVDLYTCLKDSTNQCNKQVFVQMIEYHPPLVRYIDGMEAVGNLANLFMIKAMVRVWPVSAYLPVRGYNGITTDDHIYLYHYAKWRWINLKDPEIKVVLKRLRELTPREHRGDPQNLKLKKVSGIGHINGIPQPDKAYSINVEEKPSIMQPQLDSLVKRETKKEAAKDGDETDSEDEEYLLDFFDVKKETNTKQEV